MLVEGSSLERVGERLALLRAEGLDFVDGWDRVMADAGLSRACRQALVETRQEWAAAYRGTATRLSRALARLEFAAAAAHDGSSAACPAGERPVRLIWFAFGQRITSKPIVLDEITEAGDVGHLFSGERELALEAA